ncbi:MAG: cytochrome c oxidase assembly protein [Sphingomonadaceae bacterium]|nr:cytochrome c oxidase assembly protein [Sphingomonadaceae bacterium]
MSTRTTGLISGGVALAMLGAAYAAVPLYRMFCAATGWDGTPRRADESALPKQAAAQTVTVRFDANTGPGMVWNFKPAQVTQTIHVGQKSLAFFRASNPTDQATSGQAVFNVSPDTVGRYFTKIQCFCFNEQTLGPHQSADMPVVYFIDPAYLTDKEAAKVKEITLSYTFYPMKPGAVKTEAVAAARSRATARIEG